MSGEVLPTDSVAGSAALPLPLVLLGLVGEGKSLSPPPWGSGNLCGFGPLARAGFRDPRRRSEEAFESSARLDVPRP